MVVIFDCAVYVNGIDILRVDPAGNVHDNTFKGFNIWAVYFATGFLGNSRVDPCSRVLKREAIQKFMGIHDTKQLYLGIKADEINRFITITNRYKTMGIEAICPMYLEENWGFFNGESELDICSRLLGYSPLAYDKGFKHNNCSDFCIKAGLAQLEKGYWYNRKQFRIYAKLEKLFNLMFAKDGVVYTVYSRVVDGAKVGVPMEQLLDEFDKKFETQMFPPYEDVGDVSCVHCD